MHGEEDTRDNQNENEEYDLEDTSNARDGYAVHGGDHFAQLMEAGQASAHVNEDSRSDAQRNINSTRKNDDAEMMGSSGGQQSKRFFPKRSTRLNSSESLKNDWNMQDVEEEDRDVLPNETDGKTETKVSPLQKKTADNFLREIDHNNRSISIDRSQSIEVKRLLRMASMSVVSEHVDERSLDEKRLARAVADAGESANGIYAVEVWTLDEETGRLERPSGGWWRDESLTSKLIKWSDEERKALCTFEESTHPDFAHVGPTSPGVDLAGELWVEGSASASTKLFGGRISHEVRRAFSPHRRQSLSNENRKTHQESPSRDFMDDLGTPNSRVSALLFSRSHDSRLRLGMLPSVESRPAAVLHSPTQTEGSARNGRQRRGAILWRDIHSLVVDPDIAKTPRLSSLETAGLGLAAGVHFDVGGHSGMVIYFARSEINTDILTALPNQVYMIRMAELIGAVVASTDARRAAVALKLGDHEGMPNIRISDEPSSYRSNSEVVCVQRIRMWLQKCKGGDLQIPPSLSLAQSFWTAFGAFSSLILLSGANEFIIKGSNDKYFLLMGPVGALVTLQFGLTAAPASQPRNIVLGQCVAGVTSLAFTYVPTQVLQPWLRVALAPAISIGIMARLGIIHPPAGAASVVLSSGRFNWMFFCIFMVCNVLSLVPAIVINNLSRKRQYPTYWGIPRCCSPSFFSKTNKFADE